MWSPALACLFQKTRNSVFSYFIQSWFRLRELIHKIITQGSDCQFVRNEKSNFWTTGRSVSAAHCKLFRLARFPEGCSEAMDGQDGSFEAAPKTYCVISRLQRHNAKFLLFSFLSSSQMTLLLGIKELIYELGSKTCSIIF